MTDRTHDELRTENEQLRRLVLALAEKLATVAEHLGRLAERKEFRKTDVLSGSADR